MMTNEHPVTLRAATVDDVPLILRFICELADYERLAHEVTATEEQLQATLFGLRPCAEVALAFMAGEPVGYALFFTSYSTFLAKPGIYLEDLFVSLAARGRGVGKALLAHVARLAVERDCGRLEWSALDWNAPAIGFYKSLGAEAKDEWTIYRLKGDALLKLAEL